MKKIFLAHTIISIFLMFSLSFSCISRDDVEHHYRIRFVNESEQTLYVDYSTFHPDAKPILTNGRDKVLPVKTNNSTLSMPTSWEYVFGADIDHENLNPLDTLMVFVFDARLLETNPSHVEDALLVRYDLSLYDLRRLNWTLAYPPTENMKDMKMWPEYEEE